MTDNRAPWQTHPDGMSKADFVLGKDFYTVTGRWRCTDVGTRVTPMLAPE